MNDSSQHSHDRLALALLAASVASVVASRVCHRDLVWIEEAYGMAAASELLRGKHLYTDIWFDKPPGYAWFYTLGNVRVLGVAWVLLCAWSVYLAARQLWDRTTGILAAALACLALTFWIPSAVMAVAPDLLLFVPQVLAVWAIASGRPFTAGVLAGAALLCNLKALLLVPLLIAWDWRRAARTMAGFAAVAGASLLVLPVREYWHQVWWWGSRYSADTFVVAPVREFFTRTLGWAGFHATAVVGCAVYLWRSRDWRLALWIGLSLLAVVAGLRFFPRYYFQLLPAVVLGGARGLMMLPRLWRFGVLALLLIPAIRFGPRYVHVALQGTSGWADAAMMEDSRDVSRRLEWSGSLFVWGYRPDIYVFSGLPAGTRFLDSQPVTGVLADRHLFSSKATFPELAAEYRRELTRTRPEFIVDGLGPLNPELAIGGYADLQGWLRNYEEIGRTRMSVILRRRGGR